MIQVFYVPLGMAKLDSPNYEPSMEHSCALLRLIGEEDV